MGCRQAIPVIRPALWQIERPVYEGMTMPGDIGCEHTDLTIGDLASRTCILPTNTARCLALLEKAVRRANDSLDHSLARLTIKHENGIGIG